ncbi:MAG: hypothetical protein PHV57_01890 [Methanomicrobiaceae archaeon]|nr:hypothetical protein [Methanomicrobiaceae archaeon]
MENLLSNLPEDSPHVIGFTIITGPGGIPDFSLPDDEDYGIEFELVEGEDSIYITAEVQPDPSSIPYATFREDTVTLCTGDEETIIELDCDIDTEHSFYKVRHGVIDVVCRKLDRTSGGRCATRRM